MKLVLKLGLMALLACLATRPAGAATLSRIQVADRVETGSLKALPASELRGSRMRLTLGLGAADDFDRNYYRYRSHRNWPYLRGRDYGPFRDFPSRYRPRFSHRFDHYDPWFESGSSLWQRRYRRAPHHLRLEWREEVRPRSLRVYPSHQTQASHRAWCYQQYRSYRASDNSYQPYRGGRKRCQSPYGR